MNLNYYFSSRHVSKKHQSVYFVVSVVHFYFDMISYDFEKPSHLSVKEFGSRSDGRLTQVYTQS